MVKLEGVDFDATVPGGKREQQLKGVAVGLAGMGAYALDMGQVVIEELMKAGRKSHVWLLRWALTKSTNP
jgi:hypothetical protein